MNIDANAWVQPREKCNETLSKPEDQRKGRKKSQPKSWWVRPSSPGFSAWCKVIPPPRAPVSLSEEADKSQRPQGHHTDHIPNRGTRKTTSRSIFTGLYTRYRRDRTEAHVSPEVPTPMEAPGTHLSAFPRETASSSLRPLPPPASLLCLRKQTTIGDNRSPPTV